MRAILWAVALLLVVWLLLRKQGQATVTTDGGTVKPPVNDFSSPMQSYVDPVQDPSLIDRIVPAVMHAESGGRQTDANGRTLRSSAGALGLMQLMPSTAAQFGVDPNDASQNVAGGTQYLQQLFDKYGDWPDALAAYNWGPGNLDKAKAQGRDLPDSVKSYVQGIIANA